MGGGHSIDDAEPKYGLAVVGTVDPALVLTNRDAQAGDVLVLTKPIGLGVISTAVKRDAADAALLAEAVRIMTTLNAGARDAAVALGGAVHAATDVTGFGLLGHLRELLAGSDLAADLDAGAVPVIDGVRELIAAGMVAGRHPAQPRLRGGLGGLGRPPARRAVAPRRRPDLGRPPARGGSRRGRRPRARAHARGTLAAAVIGRTRAGEPGHITIT